LVSLDPMRHVFPLYIAVLSLFLVSCASVRIGDLRCSGRVNDVSVSDLHFAIEADRSHTSDKIYEIEVVSSREMHVYHDTRSRTINYDIIKRVGGRWIFVKETGFLT
jgi:hypothetical protein